MPNHPDIRRMLDYLDWANTQTLGGVQELDETVLHADVGASFGSILGTLRHMLMAERLWFARWTGDGDASRTQAPDDLLGIATAWEALAKERRAWSARTDGAVASPRVEVAADPGNDLAELVFHVVTHAAMHRGQVIGMMRQAGVTPPATGMRTFMTQGS
jgi:uncharacterized damage-inducible protein DinB